MLFVAQSIIIEIQLAICIASRKVWLIFDANIQDTYFEEY